MIDNHEYIHGDDCYDEGEYIEREVAFADIQNSAPVREYLEFFRQHIQPYLHKEDTME